jgi:death-on-curing protein
MQTAFAATYTFLAINGPRLTADSEEICDLITGLYRANPFCFEKLVLWPRCHVKQGPASLSVCGLGSGFTPSRE